MLMYSLAPFIGPCIGPLIGGFINTYLHWRWTYYVLIIITFVLLVAIVVLVPETYRECLVEGAPLSWWCGSADTVQIRSSCGPRRARSEKRQVTSAGRPPSRR